MKVQKKSFLSFFLFWTATVLSRTVAVSSLLSLFVAAYRIQQHEASSDDVMKARKILFENAMNPLSISKENMIVVYDDFNDETIQQQQQQQRQQQQQPKLIGFGQIRPIGRSVSNDGTSVIEYSELASLYVEPEHRHRGIGGTIVDKLMERHRQRQQQQQQHQQQQKPTTTVSSVVCLLTLKPLIPFYESHGFQVIANRDEIQRLPTSLQLEYTAGSFVSLILGNDIVCMIERKY
jgi:ribosomal protein S18 acetylase RimI-like enzyme